MNGPFQNTFGRSPQTKILDTVLDQNDAGINVKDLAKSTGPSHAYTVNIVKDLEHQNLVRNQRAGQAVLVKPNMSNPIVKAIGGIGRKRR